MSGENGFHSPLKPTRMDDSMPHPLGPHSATNSNSTADSENQMRPPYMDSISGDEAISRIEVDFPNMNTTGALLDDDDAISAAMEAIAEANRFNTNLADSEADTDCTDSGTRPSLKTPRTTNHKDNSAFNYGCEKLEAVQIGLHQACSTDSETQLSTAVPYCHSNPVYLDSTEFHDCGTPPEDNSTDNSGHAVSELVQTVTLSPKPSTALLPSSGETFLHANWRPILRPIFERVLIERLWTQGELGASNPQALLLTMWFFISRHFGIGCRTDHARLVLGNLQVGTDPKSDANCLVFVRPSGKDSRKTSSVPRYSTHSKYPDARLPARPDCLDRCPVHLFEQFRARRPISAHGLNTPLYLQPERTALALQSRSKFAVWFTPNALGKNRIGSMLNMALLKLGMPVGRQVNLMRFCDALAATAITSAGGEAGSRLVQLMSDAHLDAVNFDRELTACAEHVVNQACIHGSALHRALASACEGSITINTSSGCASVSSGTGPRTVRSTNLTDETTLPRVRFVPIRPISTERNATVSSNAGANPVAMSLIGSKSEGSVTGATSLYVPHTPQFDLMPLTPSMNNMVTESIPAFGTGGDNLTILMKTEGLPERNAHEVHTKTMKFERHPLFALDNQEERASLTHASDTNHNLLVENPLRNESGLITGCSRPGGVIEHAVPTVSTTSLPCSSVFVLGSQSVVPLMVPSPHLLSSSVASATASAPSTTITATSSSSNSTTTTTVGTTDVVPIASRAEGVSLQTSSLLGQPRSCPVPVSENAMNMPQLVGSSQLIPITLLSATTSVKPSSSCPVQVSSSTSNSQVVIPTRHDDIQLDYRKSGTGYARSVPLELRELLDVVLTVAQFVPSPTSHLKCKLYWPGSNNSTRISRPPVGLVTQLLWRARALDDRGPWILTFSMWWLMQHYFGIGSRSHHVRLRWSNLRLITGVIDPMTGRSCEALEYAGPPEYTTVKAFALLESTGDRGQPVRRVYPSSGWAEAEIHVASVLAADAPDKRPRIRPLDTGPDVPGIATRDGPDFVALYKAFCEHRPSASRQSDSPFYVQPLHCKPTHWRDPVTTPWFGLDALGKNRIGALMRNIVDKVVRVNLARVARAATVAAKHSCIEVVKRAVLSMPQTIQSPQSSTALSTSDMLTDLITRRQLLVDRLADLLGLSSVMVTESGWLDQLNASTRVTAVPLTTLSTQSGQGPEVSEARLNEVQTSIISSSAPVAGLVNLTDRLKDTGAGSQTSPVLQIITEQSGAVMLHPQVLEPDTGSRMSTQVVLLTANQSNTNTTTTHSLIPPATSTQGGLILIPATLASTPNQHDLLSPGSLLAGAGQRVEPQQSVPTSASGVVTASTGSLLKPTSCLLNRATSACLGQSVAYLTQTTNQAPVNLLLLNPSPIGTVPTVTTPNADPSKTHSADATTLLSRQNGTPAYNLISKTDVNCLGHGRSGSNANPVFLYGNPGTDLLSNHTIKLEQTAQSNAILEQVYPPCSAFTQAMDTPAQSVMLSTPTLTHSQPTLSSLLSFNPNSLSVSIPTDTMRMNQFPMINTIRLDHANSTGESTRASSSNSRDPLSPGSVHPLQSNAYYTMTNPNTRYIIPPPSASLLPGKPTPMSESLPTLSVVLDPQTRNTNTTLTSPDQHLGVKQTDSSVASDTYQQASNYESESTGASRTRTTIGSLIPVLPLSEMTCHTTPPEPGPDQLLTLQTVIDQAWACHCRDFRGYVEQLFRTGLLSASSPWCLNFSAWFINSVAFEVENRAEHVSLRWGDFRLCQTADGSTEYLYFINRTTHRAYYLAASAPSPHSLGHNPNASSSAATATAAVGQETVDGDMSICCPCPVAIFKALRDHRPLTCLDPYSKFYLQPRFQDPIDRNKLSETPSAWPQVSMQDRDWFLERPWGKNRVGSLFTEATKLAGLPMICLRKHRARVAWPNSIDEPNFCLERKPAPSVVGRDPVHRDGSDKTSSTDFAKRPGLLDTHPVSKRPKISHRVPVTCSSLSSQSADLFSVGTTSTPVQLPSSSTILRQSPVSCSSAGD